LFKTLRDTYGTIKKAKGTQLHDLYRKADLQFQSAKARLRASAKKEARQQFFDSIDTQEVNEQLDPSILGLERKALKSKTKFGQNRKIGVANLGSHCCA